MTKLKYILRKISDLRYAILRSKQEHQTTSVQLEALKSDEEFSNWVVTDEMDEAMVNQQVSIIQKQNNDYIYITGQVTHQRTSEKTFLSVQILKACWMVKRSEGNLTWLDEKMVYEADLSKMRLAS